MISGVIKPRASVVECGWKRSATPISSAEQRSLASHHSSGARKRCRRCKVPLHLCHRTPRRFAPHKPNGLASCSPGLREALPWECGEPAHNVPEPQRGSVTARRGSTEPRCGSFSANRCWASHSQGSTNPGLHDGRPLAFKTLPRLMPDSRHTHPLRPRDFSKRLGAAMPVHEINRVGHTELLQGLAERIDDLCGQRLLASSHPRPHKRSP
jgi:hypothetical protein